MTFKLIGITKDAGHVSYTFDLDVKDEKFRYVIRNFWHHQGTSNADSPGDLRVEKSGFNFSKKAWIQIKEQTDKIAKQIIKNLISSMSVQDNDDW